MTLWPLWLPARRDEAAWMPGLRARPPSGLCALTNPRAVRPQLPRSPAPARQRDGRKGFRWRGSRLTLAQRREGVPLEHAHGVPCARGVAAAHQAVPRLAGVVHCAAQRPRRPVQNAAVPRRVGQAAVRGYRQTDAHTDRQTDNRK